MLDIKQIRENPQAVQQDLNRRGNYDLQSLLEWDGQRRSLEQQRVQLETRSNEIGKLVGQQIKSGSDPKGPEIQALKDEGQEIKARLSQLDPQEKQLEAEIEQVLLTLPNLPSQSTPEGKTEADKTR